MSKFTTESVLLYPSASLKRVELDPVDVKAKVISVRRVGGNSEIVRL